MFNTVESLYEKIQLYLTKWFFAFAFVGRWVTRVQVSVNYTRIPFTWGRVETSEMVIRWLPLPAKRRNGSLVPETPGALNASNRWLLNAFILWFHSKASPIKLLDKSVLKRLITGWTWSPLFCSWMLLSKVFQNINYANSITRLKVNP